MKTMNKVKLSAHLFLLIFFVLGSVENSAAETKDSIEIAISTTRSNPAVGEPFELRVTVTNHRSTTLSSKNPYIIRVLAQTNDTNIEYTSASNSNLDPSATRTERWVVSFNETGIKLFKFVFESLEGSDLFFDTIYTTEVGVSDAEPGDMPDDVGFEGPTNKTEENFFTTIGGGGSLAIIFAISFILLGYLLLSKFYSTQKES